MEINNKVRIHLVGSEIDGAVGVVKYIYNKSGDTVVDIIEPKEIKDRYKTVLEDSKNLELLEKE